MTADNDNTSTTGEQGGAAKSRKRGAPNRSRTAKKASPRKSAGRTASAKSGRSAAAEGSQASSGAAKRGRGASRKGGAPARKQGGVSASGITGAAGRLVSRGRRAASSAYDWASEGASRAVPLARSAMPDQRLVQRLVDERPYMLGAIGLGIGAMIGLMLPNPFNSGAARSSGRSGGGSRGGRSSRS